MIPIIMINKLEKMSKSLKDKNIIEYLPTIIKDLEYLLNSYTKEIIGITIEQKIKNIYTIEYYRIEYLAELIKKYMELKYEKKFSYEIVEDYFAPSTYGYNQEKDTVVISKNGDINTSDCLADIIKSIAHEYRHQYLYHFLHEKDIKGILNYPSYFIIIAKNMLPKEIKVEKDKDGKIINKPYNKENYKRLYMEQDANNYGLEVIRRLLPDLYEIYPYKDQKLKESIDNIQKTLDIQGRYVQEKLKEQGKLDSTYLSEIYLKKPIISKVSINNISKDSLIYIDRCIKDNPLIKDKYEILNILMDDYKFKGYWEIIKDRYLAIGNKCGDEDKIKAIYENIISIDPIALITKFIVVKDNEKIKEFIKNHPTFPEEYKEEIDEIFNEYILDSEIIHLFNKEEHSSLEKKS